MNGLILVALFLALGGAIFLVTSASTATNRPATHAAIAVCLAVFAAIIMLSAITF